MCVYVFVCVCVLYLELPVWVEVGVPVIECHDEADGHLVVVEVVQPRACSL